MQIEDVTALAALLAAIAALISVLYVARQVLVGAKANQLAVLLEVHRVFRARLPNESNGDENAFYALRHAFNAAEAPDGWSESAYREGIVARVRIVAGRARSDDAQYRREVALVKHVVNAYNDVADLVDNDLVEVEPVLKTYHLPMIREMFIAEPYLWHEAVVLGRGRWGFRALRLGEIAREYHRMNPIHRGTVAADDDKAPILARLEPTRVRRLAWWLRRRFIGYPRITHRSKLQQMRTAETFRRALESEIRRGAE